MFSTILLVKQSYGSQCRSTSIRSHEPTLCLTGFPTGVRLRTDRSSEGFSNPDALLLLLLLHLARTPRIGSGDSMRVGKLAMSVVEFRKALSCPEDPLLQFVSCEERLISAIQRH